MFIGLLLVFNALLPIISYEIFTSGNFQRIDLLSPVGQGVVAGSSTEKTENTPIDYTKPANWFVGLPRVSQETTAQIKYYNLSIPRLGIKDAVVEIDGEDLKKSLIHFKGTAVPGRPGNTVVFGHSTLPQLFKPDNYISIFSTLSTLKKGDVIKVNYDGINYTYKVEDMFEVKPTEVEVMYQMYDDSYISLITCVPPGTYLRRLVVRGRLVPPGGNR